MGAVYEDSSLRDRIRVFRDREEAGERLALFVRERFDLSRPVICPIPAGGIPIGVALARSLAAPLRPVVVRKIQIPWSTESGFGAVTWNGDVILNQELLPRLSLTPEEIEEAISHTRENVQERIQKFTSGRSLHGVDGSTVILTDDGLASGFTMRAAVGSIRKERPNRVMVAVPTGSLSAVRMVSAYADDLVCLNIRGGFSFAVADAYRHWHDLSDEEVLGYLEGNPGSE
jgi:putative phosphoribosyl transferase